MNATDYQARKKQRYNYFYISIALKRVSGWELVKAFDWNETGFNFYHTEKIPDGPLQFKKEMTAFTGSIVWTRKNESDQQLLEMLLNEKLFTELQKLAGERETIQRIFKMIRTSDMIDEKIKLLTHLGNHLSDGDIVALLKKDRDRDDIRQYRYGVKVASSKWSDIVNTTIEQSARLLRLDTEQDA